MTKEDLEFLLNAVSSFSFLVIALGWKNQLQVQRNQDISFRFLELLYSLRKDILNASIWVSPRAEYDRNLLSVAWESIRECERFSINYKKYLDKFLLRKGAEIIHSSSRFLSDKVEYESVKNIDGLDDGIGKLFIILQDELKELNYLYIELRKNGLK